MKNESQYDTLIRADINDFGCTQKDVPTPEALLPVPSVRQMVWHEMEQYAFVHFTTNTFTDKEWGFGDERTEVLIPKLMIPNNG